MTPILCRATRTRILSAELLLALVGAPALIFVAVERVTVAGTIVAQVRTSFAIWRRNEALGSVKIDHVVRELPGSVSSM